MVEVYKRFEDTDYISPLRGGTYWSNEILLDETEDEIALRAKKWPWLPVILNCICVVIFFVPFIYLFSKDEAFEKVKYLLAFIAILTLLIICFGVYIQNQRASVPRIIFSRSKQRFSFPVYSITIDYEKVQLFQLIIGDGWGDSFVVECNVIVKKANGAVRYPVFQSGSMPKNVKKAMESFASKTGISLQCVQYGIRSSPKSITYI